MNLFNTFQAVAFYTMLPLLAQYLFTNEYNAWGYVAVVANFLGYCLMSVTVHEGSKKL